jgi:hypothetical protein
MRNPMIPKTIAAQTNSMKFGGRTNIVFSLSDLSSLLDSPTKKKAPAAKNVPANTPSVKKFLGSFWEVLEKIKKLDILEIIYYTLVKV